MQSPSPQRKILEKRGSMIKQPNDSPTISPSQLLKVSQIDPNNLTLKMVQVQGPVVHKSGTLVVEDHNSDLDFMGEVPQKLQQQKTKSELKEEYAMSKVDQQRSSMSPDKQMTSSQISQAYPTVVEDFSFSQKQEFLYSPIQRVGIVQCALSINKSGFNTFRPKFYFIKDNECFMAAKKVGEKFFISMDKENIERKSPQFIGQISCKKNKTYYFYDTGFNVKKKKEPIRKCLGELKFINPPKPTQPRQQEVNLHLSQFKFPNTQDEYCNRTAKWDAKLNTHILNFYERVKISSIKNFQLIMKDEMPEKIYIQMGKWDKRYYNLDIAAPFSPILGFMIGLCNYDQKLQV